MNGIQKILAIILGVLIILTGLYCVFTPGMTYSTIGYVVGFSMLMDGVAMFIFWWQARKEGYAQGIHLVSAILSFVCGLLVLNSAILQLGIDLFIIYYIAIWLIVTGCIVIYRGYQINKFHQNHKAIKAGSRWYIFVLLGIIMIVLGALSIYNPDVMANTIGIFIGLGVMITGADLITIATTPVEEITVEITTNEGKTKEPRNEA